MVLGQIQQLERLNVSETGSQKRIFGKNDNFAKFDRHSPDSSQKLT
ncbi:MAG: hypothetical protein J7641_05085 [Cyanobacteria bacterium SID2]|nr:hypothetical protein [Cyanobacteria bacterium SID2]MBP0006188.1 hypothetical protein [Cyanobacteria bacterium SBC]